MPATCAPPYQLCSVYKADTTMPGTWRIGTFLIGAYLMVMAKLSLLSYKDRPDGIVMPQQYNSEHQKPWMITVFDSEDESWKRSLIRITSRENITQVYTQIERHSPMSDRMLKNITFLPTYRNPCWKDLNKLHCLPFFFVAGFSKCGTSDLFRSLAMHPDIVAGSMKEFHWFDRARYGILKGFKVGEREDFYIYVNGFYKAAETIDHFVSDDGLHPKVTFDGTPSTLWDNKYLFQMLATPEQNPPVLNIHSIRAYLPEAKLVLIVRNPTDAMWSAYWFFNRTSRKSPQLFHTKVVEAIDTFSRCFFNKKPFLYCLYGDLDDNFVLDRLRSYLFQYHIDIATWTGFKVHVVELEDYSIDRVAVMNSIFKFLGLSEVVTNKEVEEKLFGRISNNNPRGHSVAMQARTRNVLDTFYSAANEKLHKFIQGQSKK